MDKLKQWVVLSAVTSLAVLALGWFLLVAPQRHQAADLHAQQASAESENDGLRTKLSVLRSEADKVGEQQAQLDSIARQIPDVPGQPDLVRALQQAATGAGVQLVTVAPGALQAAVSATSPTSTGSAASTGTSSLQAMPVSITAAGTYFQVQQFLAALEQLPRALRVTNVSLANGLDPTQTQSSGVQIDDGKHVLATLTAQAYVAPGSAAAPGAPATSSAPTQ